jgi:hypothetical protein
MTFAGALIDIPIVFFVGTLIFMDILSIRGVLYAEDIDFLPKVFSTISSVLVLIFIVYRPMERLMPYARSIVNAVLGL